MDLILRRLMDLEATVENLKIRTESLEILNGNKSLVKVEIKDDNGQKIRKQTKICTPGTQDENEDVSEKQKPNRPKMRDVSIKLVRIPTPPQSPVFPEGDASATVTAKSTTLTSDAGNVQENESPHTKCVVLGPRTVEKSSEEIPSNRTTSPTVPPSPNIQNTSQSITTAGRKPRRKYKCQFCNKTYKYNHTMIRHLSEHTQEKIFSCTHCPKRFTRKDYMDSHNKIHTVERLYACNTCPATFKHKVHLNRHYMIHTGEKPFECSICFKSFGQNESLVLHSRTHTGEKPFPCDVCDKTFKSSSGRFLYMRSHK